MKDLRNLTARQIKAARSLLDWSQDDLAAAATLSVATIRKIESGHISPRGSTNNAIRKAFSQHDVLFTENEGVQIRKEVIKTFSGRDGFIEKLDHVYDVVSSQNPITRHLALSDDYAAKLAPQYIAEYSEKMGKISGLDARCLIWEGDQNMPFDYCQYRWLRKSSEWITPFYVYGDYVSLYMKHTTPKLFMTVSIYSETLADNMKKQFDILWNNAMVPKKMAGVRK
jgi:transcriptional regulator with XRE-family HTH domain